MRPEKNVVRAPEYTPGENGSVVLNIPVGTALWRVRDAGTKGAAHYMRRLSWAYLSLVEMETHAPEQDAIEMVTVQPLRVMWMGQEALLELSDNERSVSRTPNTVMVAAARAAVRSGYDGVAVSNLPRRFFVLNVGRKVVAASNQAR